MKVLSCDDHDLFRAGLRQALEEVGASEVLEAGTAAEALRLVAEVEQHEVEVLVLGDLGLPDQNGADVLARLRADHPLVPVAVLSGGEEPAKVRAALDAGAVGFIPKSSNRELLLSALRVIQAGGVYVPPLALDSPAPAPTPRAPRAAGDRDATVARLTPRQREVLELVSKGLTNKEICSVLGIAEGTVKGHLATLFEVLDVTNRTEAVRVMAELGLVEED